MNPATKSAALLRLLRRQWVTVKESQQNCGINSLAQRVSEWRAEGIVIQDKWVEQGGSRFKAYFCPRKGGKC